MSDIPVELQGVIDSSTAVERNIVARLVKPPDYKLPKIPPEESFRVRWFKGLLKEETKNDNRTLDGPRFSIKALESADSTAALLQQIKHPGTIFVGSYQNFSAEKVTLANPDGPGTIEVDVNTDKGSYFKALQEPVLFGEIWQYDALGGGSNSGSTVDYKWVEKKALPSAIYIEAAQRLISTPYIPKDPRKYQNGLEGYGNLFKDSILYLWKIKEDKDNTLETPRIQLGIAANDMTLRIVPQDVNATKPMKALQLYPDSFDPNIPKNSLGQNSVGAFMLRMAIQKGEGPKRGRPWSIRIKFGEVEIDLKEDSSALKVYFRSKERSETVEFPDLGTRGVEDFGDRAFALTFIPLWDGLLISDLPPSNIYETSDRVKFIPLHDKTGEDYAQDIMTAPERAAATDEEQKKKTKKVSPYPSKLPMLNRKGNKIRYYAVDDPKVKDPPLSRDLFGISVLNEQRYRALDTKAPLEITYRNCGGQLQFVPVYFVPNIRVHNFELGEPQDQSQDIKKLELPPCKGLVRITDPGESTLSFGQIVAENTYTELREQYIEQGRTPPEGIVGTEEEFCDNGSGATTSWASVWKDLGRKPVSDMPVAQTSTILGVAHWPSRYGIVQKCRSYALPGTSDAINDIVLDIRRRGWQTVSKEQSGQDVNPANTDDPENTEDTEADKAVNPVYIRQPVEVFGFIDYRYFPIVEDPKKKKSKKKPSFLTLRNGERILSLNDIPENRIRSIQVSRNLDGSSGSITWDRYDPTTGLFPRPDQFVGTVSLAVSGGNDIVPGVFWTGFAMGNAVVNNESSNEVRTNLFGREAKISEGGIHIVNAPYFDGWDHVEVLNWLGGYAGLPIRNLAAPYQLPVSGQVLSPNAKYAVDFASGTPVWDCISELCKLAGTQGYFDRFGRFVYLEQNRHTGVNWEYPDQQVEQYDDEPDLSQIRNSLIITGLYSPSGDPQKARTLMLGFKLDTYPEFEFEKMKHYAVNGVFRTKAEFNRAALRVARQTSRPRATGSVSIPGNSKIELLDTFNKNWLVVSISHSVDTQAKTYRTNLALEYLLQGDVTGLAAYLPLPNFS